MIPVKFDILEHTELTKVSGSVKNCGHYSIPVSWGAFAIGDLVKFEGGSQPPRSEFIHSEQDGYVRLIQIRDYKTDEYKTYIPVDKARKFCDETDVMIGRYGPPIFQILRGLKGAYNVALIKASPKRKGLLKDYLYYYLKNETLFLLIDRLSRRTSGQTGIDMDALNGFPFPLPPIGEQKAILDILQTWDNAIQLKTKLIKQKKEFRRNITQRLLMGSIRWNDGEKFTAEEIQQRIDMIDRGQVPKGYQKTKNGIFPVEWNERAFDELFSFESGYPASRSDLSYESEGICYLHYGDIHLNSANYLDVDHEHMKIPKISEGIGKIGERYLLKDGDIVFADASEDYEGIGKSIVVFNKSSLPIVAGLHTIVARDKTTLLVKEFKRFFLSNHAIRRQVRFYASGISVFGLSKSNIKKIVVVLPDTLEQQRIGHVLSALDEDLSLLEQEIKALEEQKKGLMQLLMTGKVRVQL